MKNDLNKSLYQAVMKALNSSSSAKDVAQAVIKDINDSDMIAEVPKEEIPATAEGVLHKDVSVSEIHQQKQANANAALGIPPKPKMPKVGKPTPMKTSEEGAIEKGVHKLKSFMSNREMKKGQQHPAEKAGISTVGSQVRTANFNKEHGFKEAANQGISQAKDNARIEVWRQKNSPKPNLPKSENMGKSVHKPFADKGTSIMGHANRGNWAYGNKEQNKKTAIEEAKKVIEQGKKASKPNLPK